jgi:hypothetical protein
MIQVKERGEPLDAEGFARRVASAVADVVRKQAESGIDIVADGEMGCFGFIPYVNERLAGIEPRNNAGRRRNWAQSREYLAFPEYYQWASQMPGGRKNAADAMGGRRHSRESNRTTRNTPARPCRETCHQRLGSGSPHSVDHPILTDGSVSV